MWERKKKEKKKFDISPLSVDQWWVSAYWTTVHLIFYLDQNISYSAYILLLSVPQYNLGLGFITVVQHETDTTVMCTFFFYLYAHTFFYIFYKQAISPTNRASWRWERLIQTKEHAYYVFRKWFWALVIWRKMIRWSRLLGKTWRGCLCYRLLVE